MTNEILKNSTIEKLDNEKHLVFAWAYVSSIDGKPLVDHQGDVWDIEEIEKTAHDFMLNSRDSGEMHLRKGVGKVVESIVLDSSKQKALGIDLKKEGWLVVIKIDDDDVWDKVKNGEYSMLSIGGKGKRESIDEEE